MDPNATLRLINEAARAGLADDDRVDEACSDLFSWLARGGFQPDWSAYPAGSRIYLDWCRSLGHRSYAD